MKAVSAGRESAHPMPLRGVARAGKEQRVKRFIPITACHAFAARQHLEALQKCWKAAKACHSNVLARRGLLQRCSISLQNPAQFLMKSTAAFAVAPARHEDGTRNNPSAGFLGPA